MDSTSSSSANNPRHRSPSFTTGNTVLLCINLPHHFRNPRDWPKLCGRLLVPHTLRHIADLPPVQEVNGRDMHDEDEDDEVDVIADSGSHQYAC